jgi:hypothetical protein
LRIARIPLAALTALFIPHGCMLTPCFFEKFRRAPKPCLTGLSGQFAAAFRICRKVAA